MGLRRKPGRLALVVFRLPLALYQRGWGGPLGGTFLLLVHAGRKTGKLHQVVAMVLRYLPYLTTPPKPGTGPWTRALAHLQGPLLQRDRWPKSRSLRTLCCPAH